MRVITLNLTLLSQLFVAEQRGSVGIGHRARDVLSPLSTSHPPGAIKDDVITPLLKIGRSRVAYPGLGRQDV
jgi:hypothetical protein